MTDHDPDDVIDAAERQKATVREHYLPAAEWFLENPGMGPRQEVVGHLAEDLDVDREIANLVVGHLVEDDVDPVQQVVQPRGDKYVGVIDHAEHEWFYAFDRYDDVDGRERRAVCAHCVKEERTAADVAHVTRAPDEFDVESARVALAVHHHVDHEGRTLPDVLAEDLGVDPAAFAERHGLAGPGALSLRDVTRRLDADPELSAVPGGATDLLTVPKVDVEPGASLVSGTTIGGSTAWHAGNDGAGSGLDADTLDGFQASVFLDTYTTTTITRTTPSISTYTLTFEAPLSRAFDAGRLYTARTGTNFTFDRFEILDTNYFTRRTYYSNPTKVTNTIETHNSLYAIWTGSANESTGLTFTAKLYY